MCENVNINVSETNETINIVATEVQEVIDINVFETAEDVTLNITEQLIQVNVNKVTAAEQIQSDWAQTDNEALDFIKNKPTIPTNTSDLINDGEDGVNPFITANDIPPVTGFVPYTGATEDVNLGEFGLLTGNVEFDNTPTNIPTTAGAMYWNDADGTADLILKGGNVKLQIGQESVIRVVNKTATNINLLEANYQAVRVTGAQGQRLKVDLAQATNDNLSAETIGLVTETINSNQEGFITTSGLVRNINTTGSLQGETWADGDILYLSPTTAGNVTKVKPTAPNHLVIIGYVVHAHANQGSIFVKVDNGYELDELHNVKITSAANNNVLAYTSATDIWENKTVETALGYTPENVANKSTSTSLGTSDTLYPTQNAVKVYADTKFTLPALTSGSVLFSNGTTIAQDNTNLFWDDTNNRLGIGTNAPTNRFTLGATPAISLQQSPATLYSTNENTSNNLALVCADSGSVLSRAIFQGIRSRGTLLSPTAVFAGDAICTFISGAYDGAAIQSSAALSFDAESAASIGSAPQLINFITGSTGANRTTKMQVRSNGNVLIGTTTDGGFRLDVNGTARVSGNATFGTLGTGTGMFWDNTNNFLGIGTSSPSSALTLNGKATIINDNNIDFVTSTGPNLLRGIGFFGATQERAVFKMNHSSGELRIGTIVAGGYFPTFYSNGSEAFRIATTRNVLINTTTDAGFKLDVNGTARVQGSLTQNGSFLVSTTSGYWQFANSGNLTTFGSYISQQGLSYTGTQPVCINVTVNNQSASATFQIDSTTKGFLPPRMTTTQKNAIATPAAGLVVYDTTDNKHYGYNGTTWNAFY